MIKFNKIKFYSVVGFIIVTLFGSYALLQLTRIYVFSPNVSLTYLSLFMIPVGTLLYLYNTKNSRSLNRRVVEPEELQTLFNEVELYKEHNPELKKVVEEQTQRLKKIDRPKELDVVPLRQILVDLYPPEVLVSKASYELELLGEYVTNDFEFEQWEERINNNKEKSDALRAELKTLREKVAWLDRTWAEGEVIINSVSYWAWISVFAIILFGLLPLIHSEGSKLLGILHWAAFGWVGALLSVLVSIRETDVTEVGEQEGKQVIIRTVVNTAIGSIAAILLYAALSGEIIAGKIFPQQIPDDSLTNTGLSIFWGIIAGFSSKIFSGLVGIAESSFSKEET